MTVDTQTESNGDFSGPTGNKIEKRRISDSIYDVISQYIIDGTIKYGDRLNIKDIANELEVSPMPVRDAIKRLETEGIISIFPRSTCQVKVPTQKSMLAAYEMRFILELAAIEKIYPLVTASDLRNLKHYLNSMEELYTPDWNSAVFKEYVKNDQSFHREICVLTKNEYLLQSYKFNTLHLNIALTFDAGVEPNMTQVDNDHQLIYHHLSLNSPKCIEVLKSHLTICRNNMMKGEVFKSFE